MSGHGRGEPLGPGETEFILGVLWGLGAAGARAVSISDASLPAWRLIQVVGLTGRPDRFNLGYESPETFRENVLHFGASARTVEWYDDTMRILPSPEACSQALRLHTTTPMFFRALGEAARREFPSWFQARAGMEW